MNGVQVLLVYKKIPSENTEGIFKMSELKAVIKEWISLSIKRLMRTSVLL